MNLLFVLVGALLWAGQAAAYQACPAPIKVIEESINNFIKPQDEYEKNAKCGNNLSVEGHRARLVDQLSALEMINGHSSAIKGEIPSVQHSHGEDVSCRNVVAETIAAVKNYLVADQQISNQAKCNKEAFDYSYFFMTAPGRFTILHQKVPFVCGATKNQSQRRKNLI
jgi:hypothetical protein